MKKLLPLIMGSDGNISHSKLFSCIGNVTATLIIIFQAYTGVLSDEMLLIYLSIMSGHATASKILTAKQNKDENVK